MHEDLKTASEIKIHLSILVSWKPRISWENRHFSAFKYTGVSIPVTAMLLFTLYIDLKYLLTMSHKNIYSTEPYQN